MSEPKPADPQEWAEAFLTISAFLIALATVSKWWLGLPALPLSLVAASMVRGLPTVQGETP